MPRLPLSFSLSSRARWKSLATLTLVLGSTSVGASAQPEGDSLMVPDEDVVVATRTVPVVETAAQKVARADLDVEVRDRTFWRAARQEIGGKDQINEKQKPADVLAAYQGWLSSHPALHPTVAAEATVLIARLQAGSGDSEGANKTLIALWDKSNALPAGLLVRAAQARLLLDGAAPEDKAKAGAGAQTMLEPLLGRALEASHQLEGNRFVAGHEVLERYADALKAQGQGVEEAAFALKVMTLAPEHLVGTMQNENGWLYRSTIEALVGDARPEALPLALSWAKLNWVERAFDARSVKDASALVAQALLAQPKGTELLAQWAKAQKDPTLPNPRKDVALPATDAKALPDLLERLGDAPKWKEMRVSVLLWMGRDHEAMEAAVAGANKLPEGAKTERQGVMREVARVFKAHDLNIKRANGYLGWFGHPVGDNPIDLFLKDVPAKDGATVVPVEAKTP